MCEAHTAGLCPAQQILATSRVVRSTRFAGRPEFDCSSRKERAGRAVDGRARRPPAHGTAGRRRMGCRG